MQEEENIKIEDILYSLKNRWQMIVGITLIAIILSTVVSFFLIKPKYEASTKLFVGKETSDNDKKNSYNSSDVQMYQNLLKTYVDVIKTNDLIEDAIKNKNIDKPVDAINSNLKAEALTSTQIITISYRSTDKNEAKDVVDAVANQFVKKSNELISNANVKIVESVRLPEEPVSPNKKLNIAIAGVLGLAIGIGLALLLEFLDNTFKDKDQVENTLGLAVLGAIPDQDNE
ncbi:MAG: Wzz/FepE/Etk N-terminal domain-containing protein [Clostridiaceae bacterium]|nr:Wzz/FepE/Etk N-terminal domain-containing protein [Clostridiaceae bacterium]